MERLVEAVESVADQLHVLRVVLDEIRDEFQFAVRNPERFHGASPMCRVTSMPTNPCAADWAERVNRLTPDDLPPEQPASRASSPATPTPHRGFLFDLDDGA